MALRGGALLLKRPATCSVTLCSQLHDLPPDSYINKPQLGNAKRGRGGRSSFSGVVATIFGGYGYLGQHVVGQLGRCGTQMIVPYRCYELLLNPLKPGADLGQLIFTPLAVRDDESIRHAVKYSNVVINLIGRSFDTRNFSMEEANVDIARRIARISKEMNVERLIHVSHINSGIEFEPFYLKNGSEFIRTKTLGEQAVREEFPDATILRPSSMFAYQDAYISYYATRNRRFVNDDIGLPRRGKGIYVQPVFYGDVAAGIENCIYEPQTKGEVVEAVGPRRYELHDLVQYINLMTGRSKKNVKIRDMSRFSRYLLFAKLCEMNPYVPHANVSTEMLEMDSHSHVTQGHTTIEDLGVELRNIEAYAEDACQFYRINEMDIDVQPLEFKDDRPPFEVPKKEMKIQQDLLQKPHVDGAFGS